MNFEIVLRPEAEADLQEAFGWYEDRSPGLGSEFLLCVDAALAELQRHPTLHAAIHNGIRRALVRRFPFGVFYLAEDARVIVLGILHAKRNPRGWQKRG